MFLFFFVNDFFQMLVDKIKVIVKQKKSYPFTFLAKEEELITCSSNPFSLLVNQHGSSITEITRCFGKDIYTNLLSIPFILRNM